MAKVRLIIAALASIALAGTAYAADGAHWNGNAYLRASGLVNVDRTAVESWAAMQESPRRRYARAGMCSYWFSAPTTAIRRAAVYAVYPFLYSPSPTDETSVLVEHYPVGVSSSAAKLHLLVQIKGAVISKIDAYSLGTIPYFTGTETPQSKHHLMVIWDSWQGLVQFQLDGTPMGLDGSLSSSVGVPFDFAADGMSWTVGAQLITGSAPGVYAPTNFLIGDTNQMYCVLGDSVYNVFNTPEPVGATTYEYPVYFKLYPNGTKTGPYPTAMGPLCFGVFGVGREAPYVCMRGTPPTFQENAGLGDFTLVGTLGTAAFSPFDLIPTTNP